MPPKRQHIDQPAKQKAYRDRRALLAKQQRAIIAELATTLRRLNPPATEIPDFTILHQRWSGYDELRANHPDKPPRLYPTDDDWEAVRMFAQDLKIALDLAPLRLRPAYVTRLRRRNGTYRQNLPKY